MFYIMQTFFRIISQSVYGYVQAMFNFVYIILHIYLKRLGNLAYYI